MMPHAVFGIRMIGRKREKVRGRDYRGKMVTRKRPVGPFRAVKFGFFGRTGSGGGPKGIDRMSMAMNSILGVLGQKSSRIPFWKRYTMRRKRG